MKKGAFSFTALLAVGTVMSVGCGSDGSSPVANGDAGSLAGGTSSGGMAATGGASTGGATSGGSSGASSGGSSPGGRGGASEDAGADATSKGSGGRVGAGGADAGSDGSIGIGDAGAGGAPADGGDAGSAYPAGMVARGAYLVRSVALCGECHTASGGQELAGNPLFKGGSLPAPNLTPDPAGLGNWTDQQIMTAFRDGIDDEGRHLDRSMPYWLFHNMSDADARSIVAFLRGVPPVSVVVGDTNPDATAVVPLSPADFPDSSLLAADADYAAAQLGKYLLSGAAQCARCHSPSSSTLSAQSVFSGAAPSSSTQIFPPNITPDATGIMGWTAADVATALKAGTNKSGAALCGSMPWGSKGYGGLTDADARAIGVYLTTIPGVSNSAADPSLEPACP